MKTRKIEPNDLILHSHPASKLWRSIELKTLYELTKGETFRGPSLDLGGGDGYLSHQLFDSPFTYNVDNDEAGEVDMAKTSGRYKHVLKEGAEHMSLADNSLRFIFSNSVIEHIPDVEAVLHEVSRTLKKGGIFVFTSPSNTFKESLFFSNRLDSLGLGFLGNWYKEKRNNMLNHYHTYSHTHWQTLLKKYGLKMEKHAYYIDKKTGMMWDKIAVETKLLGLMDSQSKQHVWKKYQPTINTLYANAKTSKTKGASVAIYAVKQ
jgi:SAM-dependent methyltransferase